MPRYIDADKLQETYKELHDGKRSLLIDTEPTGDVVEVVRCKDCKYATYDKSIDRYDCCNWGLDGDEYTEADDFCSFGERADK